MGPEIPDSQCGVAQRLGSSDSVLRVSAGGSQGTGYIMPVTNAIENINSQLRKIIKT